MFLLKVKEQHPGQKLRYLQDNSVQSCISQRGRPLLLSSTSLVDTAGTRFLTPAHFDRSRYQQDTYAELGT